MRNVPLPASVIKRPGLLIVVSDNVCWQFDTLYISILLIFNF